MTERAVLFMMDDHQRLLAVRTTTGTQVNTYFNTIGEATGVDADLHKINLEILKTQFHILKELQALQYNLAYVLRKMQLYKISA